MSLTWENQSVIPGNQKVSEGIRYLGNSSKCVGGSEVTDNTWERKIELTDLSLGTLVRVNCTELNTTVKI